MADEYIRKADAERIRFSGGVNLDGILCVPYVEYIKGIRTSPSADVVQVVHSQWQYKCGEVRCPECGNRIHRIDLSGYLNFCPNCGAKMDKE